MSKVMPPMAKPLAQLIVVIELAALNVATSVVPEPAVFPGNVPTPVLQLFVVGAASQLLLNGDASQVALAAFAEWLISSRPHRNGSRSRPDRFKAMVFLGWFFIGFWRFSYKSLNQLGGTFRNANGKQIISSHRWMKSFQHVMGNN